MAWTQHHILKQKLSDWFFVNGSERRVLFVFIYGLMDVIIMKWNLQKFARRTIWHQSIKFHVWISVYINERKLRSDRRIQTLFLNELDFHEYHIICVNAPTNNFTNTFVGMYSSSLYGNKKEIIKKKKNSNNNKDMLKLRFLRTEKTWRMKLKK